MKKLTLITSLLIASISSVNAQWLLTGNSPTSAPIFGTMNTYDIDFYTDGNQVGRWATNGHLLLNTTSDNGNLLQVNGDGWYNGAVFVGAHIIAGAHMNIGSHLDVGTYINVGGDVNINNNLSVSNDANINNNLNINNNANVNNNLNVNNDLNVNMNATVNSNLSVVGTGSFGGTVTAPDIFASNTMGVGVTSVTGGYVFEIAGSGLASGSWISSDARYKRSIKQLDRVSDKLFTVLPKSYEFRTDEFKAKNFDKKLHFGFIAQEIEKVYPNLVNKDDKGYYAVNYIEFIPLLLQSLKEEDQKINDLQAELNELKSRLSSMEKTTGVNNADDKLKTVLDQNVPNPFSGSTTIKFRIAGNYTRAFIGVYDMQGKKVKQLDITKGAENVMLEKGTLSAGMYMYSLVVDNSLIDTKRMIVE